MAVAGYDTTNNQAFFLSLFPPSLQLFARDRDTERGKINSASLALIYRGATEHGNFHGIFDRSYRVSTGREGGDFTRADDGIIFRLGVNLKLPGREH